MNNESDTSSAGAGDDLSAHIADVLSVLDGWNLTLRDRFTKSPRIGIDDVAALIRRLASPIAGGQASDVSSAQVNECQCAPYDELGIHDFRCPILGGQASEAIKRALLSQDLYGVLMDVQNGIDSPGLASMANHAIRLVDSARAALADAQGDRSITVSSTISYPTEDVK